MTFADARFLQLIIMLAVGGLVFWWLTRRRPGGFKEWLKNPQLFNQLSPDPAAIELDIARAREWSDAELRKAVHRYLWKKSDLPGKPEKQILSAIGERVRPLVIEILGDPAVQAKLTAKSQGYLFNESPLHRACDLLTGPDAAMAIPRLIPFQSHLDEDIRKSVALSLGTMGTAAAVEPVRTALHDQDSYVRSYALIGLERAQAAGQLEAGCLSALTEDLQRLVAAGENVSAAARLLFEADPTMARDFVLRQEGLQPDSPGLSELLSFLAEKQIPVPRGQLLTLLESLERQEMKYPTNSAVASSLIILGQQREPDDREFLQSRITHPDKTVAEGAAKGLVAWVGLAGFTNRLWQALQDRELTELPVAQRRYLAVLMLDGEVNNGGFSQYFFNSAGDHWRDAQVGLDAMGFKERSELLRAATNCFGPHGPAVDRGERQEQLARLARKDEDIFDDLDTRYYASTENIEILTHVYVVRNQELFQTGEAL